MRAWIAVDSKMIRTTLKEIFRMNSRIPGGEAFTAMCGPVGLKKIKLVCEAPHTGLKPAPLISAMQEKGLKDLLHQK